MGSDTKKTFLIRMNRQAKAGKKGKKARGQSMSPPFAIHPEGKPEKPAKTAKK